MSDIFVGLDIGSSAVKVMVGELGEDGDLQVVGVGKARSTGVEKGVVRNLKATQSAVSEAVDAAEQMSGAEISSCVIGVGGAQIEGAIQTGMGPVKGNGRGTSEISQNDIDLVLNSAQAINLPSDKEIIHVIPRVYSVDGQKIRSTPINMLGKRLDAEVFVVTTSSTTVKNFMHCAEECGYNVDGVMLKTISAAKAVMTDDEQEIGSILIDIGGGTTDVLAFSEGTPKIVASFPFGGKTVTNDIGVVKGIGFDMAEKIKIESGCAWSPLIESDSEILIPGIGGLEPMQTSRIEICQIIQSRIAEIFALVKSQLEKQGYLKTFAGNIVLTGATAQMQGILELASEVFGRHAVRIGKPSKMTNLFAEYCTPEFAVCAGLLMYHAEKNGGIESPRRIGFRQKRKALKLRGTISKIWAKFQGEE